MLNEKISKTNYILEVQRPHYSLRLRCRLPMDPVAELIWGRYALNTHYITRSQLHLCIEEQGHLKEKGKEKPLSQIMVERRFINEEIAQKLTRLEGIIPGYSMGKILGAGGLGIVYKAYSEKLKQEVAIKILNPEHTDNPLILNRFLREIEISKKLDHPNIVKGLDSGQTDDLYYLVMEYVDGDNLSTIIKKYGPMKELEVIFVATTIADALSYAWKQGLTHRDIKPENMILTPAGILKICDFGLAKLVDANNVAITRSGTIVGSPHYISPEQITNAESIDYRSDIYSLGATLYYLSTGRVLFDEKTVIAFCSAHLTKEPVKPSHYISISPPLEETILRMLSKEPKERCNSSEEFIQDLLELKKFLQNQKNLTQSITSAKTSLKPERSAALRDAVLKTLPLPATAEHSIQKPSTPWEGETMEDNAQVNEEENIPKKEPSNNEFTHWSNIEKKTASKTSTGSKASTSKAKILDTILQQLLLSLDIMNMGQVSECISFQVALQLQKIHKNLSDIILEKGYAKLEVIKNLGLLRNAAGANLIPDYEIVNLIGEGGIAAVYLGRNINTNQTVAIKVFAPTISDTPNTIARFMQEAEATRKLNHPNIVKADDFGSIHGIYYLVMEYIPGLSLSQIISKVGRLSEEKALEILEQLAEALTYAWQQNIIHRDIKPGNILSDGEVFKICDLGLAKVLESGLELTQEGNIVGTPQFMSPEQFQPEKQLDFRTDIYSLGVTFYVMLTGHLPFTASTKIGLARAHLMQKAPPTERFNIAVNKETKALLWKMLEKDREKRAREMTDLIHDIMRVREGKFPKGISMSAALFQRFLGNRLAIGSILAVLLLFSGIFLYLNPGNKFPKIQKEVTFLVSLKEYERAKNFIILSNLETDEKEKLLRIVEESESKEIKILDISPKKGTQIYEDSVKLTGTIQCKNLDNLLVNDRRAELVKSGHEWSFEISLSLTIGYNSLNIVAISKDGQKVTEKHTLWRVEIDKTPPKVALLEPEGIEAGKQKEFFKDSIVLKGYATANKQIRSIKINDKTVGTFPSENPQEIKLFFEAPFQLKEGVQKITITARDERNNGCVFSFDAYLKPKGWFGEEMPQNLAKDKKYGEYVWAKDGAIMVYVPEGEFYYGEGREKARKIYTESFYIDKFEITWKLFKNFCKSTRQAPPKKPTWAVQDSHPIVLVSYRDVKAYAAWSGRELPTVAQWIKAARGGIMIPDYMNPHEVIPIPLVRNPQPFRIYPWGDESPNDPVGGEKAYRCNYCADDSFVGQAADGFMYTAGVGEFSNWNSPYGCCDMAGNVFEICGEWYDPQYMPLEGDVDPLGPMKPTQSLVKMGGGFYSLAKNCRIGIRAQFPVEGTDSQTGFRLIVKAGKR